MGLAGAFIWAWAVHSGQFSDLEKTKEQLFWPEVGPGDSTPAPPPSGSERARRTA